MIIFECAKGLGGFLFFFIGMKGQDELPVVGTPFLNGYLHHLVQFRLGFVHQLLRVLEAALAFLVFLHLPLHHLLLFGKEGLRLGKVAVKGFVAFFLIAQSTAGALPRSPSMCRC